MKAQPHHRRRPGRRGRAVDRVRPSHAARDRRKATPRSARPRPGGKAVPRRRRRRPPSRRTAASSCCPAAPRPTRKVMTVARTGGMLTELKVRRGIARQEGRRDRRAVGRGARGAGHAGEGAARSAQGRARRQAPADRAQRHAAARTGPISRRSIKAAEAAVAPPRPSATAASSPRRGPASITEVPAEVGGAAFSFAGKEIAQIVALDPMLAVVEVSERKLAGIKVGDTAEVRLVTGQTGNRPHPLRLEIGEPDHPHLSRRGRDHELRTARSRTASPPRSRFRSRRRRRRACRARR